MDEIITTTNQPLNFLLIGDMPTITKKRRVNIKSRGIKDEEPQFDMSAFPPEIKTLKRRKEKQRTIPRQQEQVQPKVASKKYLKVKKVFENIEQIDEQMQTYQDNRKRKMIQLHNEWEEQYMRPFEKRMTSQLSSRKYKQYQLEKERIYSQSQLKRPHTSLTRNRDGTLSHPPFTIPTTAQTQSPQLSQLHDETVEPFPSLRICTSGLHDRVHQYQKQAAIERELERIIKETNGTLEQTQPLKDRETMNLKAFRILPETRFFTDRPSDRPRKGKHYFPNKFQSTIDIGQFPQ